MKFFSWDEVSQTTNTPIQTVSRWQTAMLLIFLSGLIIVGNLALCGKSVGLLQFTSIVGLIGGITNNHFRCLRLMNEPNRTANLHLLRMQIIFSPVIGGVFAALFYLGAAAGLIAGDMFPKFAPGDYEEFGDYVSTIQPVHFADTSKLLFWSFVAGFSERFMPNYIDRLVTSDSDEPDEEPKS